MEMEVKRLVGDSRDVSTVVDGIVMVEWFMLL